MSSELLGTFNRLVWRGPLEHLALHNTVCVILIQLGRGLKGPTLCNSCTVGQTIMMLHTIHCTLDEKCQTAQTTIAFSS